MPKSTKIVAVTVPSLPTLSTVSAGTLCLGLKRGCLCLPHRIAISLVLMVS